MGPVGMPEMLAIFVVALLLFGPKKLPELGRLLGKGLSEFRRAKNELQATFQTHLNELEREVRLEESKKLDSRTDYSTVNYPYPYEDPYESSASYSESPAQIAAPEPQTVPAPVETASEQVGTASVPVNGTVARSNGAQPLTPVSVAAKEERPA